ncbi:SDR family NAD(P)-dependent oxidoreductase [Nocardioides sp. AX2bis]|uniref:SDR family NAD(P)-dependent oxidoreductase n=1 Tax=Nocardioides sp. AX2bis TaxID=2653157 RepID=UPI00135B8253|nr:SDR family oxidoreductase [Nocardioides sp. AX2bis]
MATAPEVLEGRGVVVTGAGRGIGRALAARAVREGARVVVNDLDADACRETAEALGATALPGDCASVEGVDALVEAATAELGRVDVWFANAGIDGALGAAAGSGSSLDTSEEVWAQVHDVNVMAHVRTARALVPRWLEDTGDGAGGRLVVTASAAGLLTMIGSAPYSVTKHAAVAFAEWLSITYGDRGVAVQAICPQGVATRMLEESGPLQALLSRDAALEPDDVAQAWVDSLADDRFLVLPHPQVADYYVARATDTDRWLAGMRRLQARALGER